MPSPPWLNLVSYYPDDYLAPLPDNVSSDTEYYPPLPDDDSDIYDASVLGDDLPGSPDIEGDTWDGTFDPDAATEIFKEPIRYTQVPSESDSATEVATEGGSLSQQRLDDEKETGPD